MQLATFHDCFCCMKRKPPVGIGTVAAPWQHVVVCGKCSKKLGGGFGPDGDDGLARALKRELRATGRRQHVQVIEAKCLGLCPKGAVTVVPGSRPGAMLVIPQGTPVAEILDRATQPGG